MKKKFARTPHAHRSPAHPAKAHRVHNHRIHENNSAESAAPKSHTANQARTPAHHRERAITVPHQTRKTETKTSRHHWWLWGLSALAALGAAFFFVRGHEEEAAKSAQHRPAPTVPVTTAQAKQGQIGDYQDALGTVTPLAMVSVTSRVQGQITAVKYTEGQMIHKGDPLVEIDPRPYEAALKQAQGQWARDRAQLNRDRVDLVRYRQAAALRAIPKQQLEDQVQAVFQDEGTVKADEGAVENAQLNLVYCHITSPIDGRVGLRLVDPGNMVQAGSTAPLATIAQMQPITVVFSIPEDHLAQVQEQLQQGQEMSVDLYDRAKEKKIATGKFLTLDNQVDPSTGTVKLKAIFDNEDEALFPNQFVNARLLVKTETDVTLVNSEAIQRNTQGPYVYVVKPDHRAEMRKIKTGTSDGDWTAVTGLKAGETVATNGFDKLQDGIKVTARQKE